MAYKGTGEGECDRGRGPEEGPGRGPGGGPGRGTGEGDGGGGPGRWSGEGDRGVGQGVGPEGRQGRGTEKRRLTGEGGREG